jgi:ABC-type multidrug transport system fused ATPase/permease subunit
MPAKVDADTALPSGVEEEKKIPSNGLRGLFTMAKPLDYLASVISALILGGLGVALVAFIFVLEPFFGGAADAESAGGALPMSIVNTMTISFIIIGSGQFLFALPGFGLTNVSAARQKREWQKAVIKSILRQNVGWYDTSNPEQLTSKIGSQIELVFKGLEGPSYGIFVALGAAVTGVAGGFSKDWKITLVVLSVCPAIVLSVWALATVLSTSTKKQNKAYGKAGGIATEALFAMRTISALGLQESFAERYSKALSAGEQSTLAC